MAKSEAKKFPFGKKNLVGKKPAKQVKTPSVPAEWLYMNENVITAAEIFHVLDDNACPDLEFWPEAGVIEIPLGEKSSLDIEATEPVMDDDFSNEFLKSHEISSLFLVTLKPESYPQALEIMKKIIIGCGGFFCGDTEDFTPFVKE